MSRHVLEPKTSLLSLPQGHKNKWCADNLTTANSVSEGTVKAFQKTGGFLCACRHSIIKTLAEMWQSREL